MFENLSKKDAEKKEIELIKKYKTKSHENGYNIENGGHTSLLSEETKKKIGEKNKGKLSGTKHWHYGKHWDKDVREKISKAHKGKKRSKEVNEKMSRMFSGSGNPMYGTKLTLEHKRKLQNACIKATSKPVICIETGIIYSSMAQAQREGS